MVENWESVVLNGQEAKFATSPFHDRAHSEAPALGLGHISSNLQHTVNERTSDGALAGE